MKILLILLFYVAVIVVGGFVMGLLDILSEEEN